MSVKKILTLALVLMMALVTLTSCSGSLSANDITGTWECSVAGDVASTMMDIAGIPGGSLVGINMILEFKSDKTFVMSAEISLAFFVESQEAGRGTWDVRDGKLYLTADGETTEIKVSGKKLYVEEKYEGKTIRLTFEKK